MVNYWEMFEGRVGKIMGRVTEEIEALLVFFGKWSENETAFIQVRFAQRFSWTLSIDSGCGVFRLKALPIVHAFYTKILKKILYFPGFFVVYCHGQNIVSLKVREYDKLNDFEEHAIVGATHGGLAQKIGQNQIVLYQEITVFRLGMLNLTNCKFFPYD